MLRLVDEHVVVLGHHVVLLIVKLLGACAALLRIWSKWNLLLLLTLFVRACCRLEWLAHELDKRRVGSIVDSDEAWHLHTGLDVAFIVDIKVTIL